MELPADLKNALMACAKDRRAIVIRNSAQLKLLGIERDALLREKQTGEWSLEAVQAEQATIIKLYDNMLELAMRLPETVDVSTDAAAH
ncbi:MAG: hypothetical protein IPJ25_14900 [Rhodocyclaceae bacterium]|nr:hypothetical protein [Rhodocyclaceae bacterium]